MSEKTTVSPVWNRCLCLVVIVVGVPVAVPSAPSPGMSTVFSATWKTFPTQTTPTAWRGSQMTSKVCPFTAVSIPVSAAVTPAMVTGCPCRNAWSAVVVIVVLSTVIVPCVPASGMSPAIENVVAVGTARTTKVLSFSRAATVGGLTVLSRMLSPSSSPWFSGVVTTAWASVASGAIPDSTNRRDLDTVVMVATCVRSISDSSACSTSTTTAVPVPAVCVSASAWKQASSRVTSASVISSTAHRRPFKCVAKSAGVDTRPSKKTRSPTWTLCCCCGTSTVRSPAALRVKPEIAMSRL
mmetsp:Transcript_81121/g.216722  ORF Transcript_81121/g.216722 Transcript_81121/m.216722 type:complete len:297 (-) Transcript_81121:482-1372(-)